MKAQTMKTLISTTLLLSALVFPALSQAAVAVPVAPSADAQVVRGAYLAKAGDCIACHSTLKGQPFAGGLPMVTPMGKIYTTNITPDPATGIGGWSLADFDRAMRRGVSKDGHNLYPAMPYPSYAKVRDDDIAALYAYFMKGVAPVRQANRASEIPFPLNMRWPLSLWNMVFLDKAVYQDKTGQSLAWNRGAYLAQGLGHCGACHTPRGVAFQEKALDESGKAWLTGTVVDNWYASNLTGEHNDGLGRWSAGDLTTFLKTGANAHASAFGGMTDVINNSTQAMSDDDLASLSAYLKSLPASGGSSTPAYAYDAKASVAMLARPANDAGAKVYAANCMHCHGVDGKAFAPLLAPLAGNPNVLAKDVTSLVNVTLNGTRDLVIGGIPAAYPMPKYANVLDDKEIADVLTFIRAGWNNGMAPVTAADVKKIRAATVAAAGN
jgi:mono/diheme cytochrome c family protein